MTKMISIIGGAGFIGTNLCQSLSDRQINFEIIDLKRSKRFPKNSKIADVRDTQSLVDTIEGDVVVNLAAVHRDDVLDPGEYFDTNVIGARNVSIVCEQKSIEKIIFTSSVAVYGSVTKPTDENGEINPFNEYGRTKILAENEFENWRERTGNRLIIVRPTVVFGEGNRGNVFNLLDQISKGHFIMVGSGKNLKSMAYVGNVVAFLEQCIETDLEYGLFNYVDSPDFDMNQLVSTVKSLLGYKNNKSLRLPFWLGLVLGNLADILNKVARLNVPISSVRVRKFCMSTQFISSKGDLDDFIPKFSLEEGLINTIKSEFISPNPNREIFVTE